LASMPATRPLWMESRGSARIRHSLVERILRRSAKRCASWQNERKTRSAQRSPSKNREGRTGSSSSGTRGGGRGVWGGLWCLGLHCCLRHRLLKSLKELYVDSDARPDEGEPPLTVKFVTTVKDS